MFKLFYFNILGDFDTFFTNPGQFSKDLPNLVWIFFIFSTLFMNVVILNLLIAVISDTYENVVSNEMLANNYEKMTILQDIENEMDEKKYKKLEKKGYLGNYIFVADFQENENEDQSQEFYSEKIRNKVSKFENKMIKIENKINKIENSFLKMENNQLKLYEKIENINPLIKKINNN